MDYGPPKLFPAATIVHMVGCQDLRVSWDAKSATVDLAQGSVGLVSVTPLAVPLLIAALRQVCPPVDDETPGYPGEGAL